MIDLARWKRVRRPRLAEVAPPLFAWAIGALLTGLFTTQVAGWYVMSDELQHVKLAISVGDRLSLTPHLRGEDVAIYSQLYPVLTAPFFALLSMPRAFDAVHVFNAVAMASTAVPVYILARELALPKLAATAAATVSVVMPWMAVAMVVMTEVVAYPAFAWALLAIHRAVARPSALRDFAALAAIALAFLARTQLLVLLVVYVAVIALHELVYPAATAAAGRRLRALRTVPKDLARGHPFLISVALLAALLALTGYRYEETLGSYGTTATGSLFPSGLLESAVQHLDRFAVALGVIPLVAAAGWALAAALRPPTREHHVFALLVLVSVPLLTLQVSSFVLRFANVQGVYDRYLFYLAPLLFVGLAVCLYAPVRRSTLLAMAAAGVVFAVIVHDIDYHVDALFFVDSPAAFFHSVLHGQSDRLGDLLGIEELSPTPLIQLVAVAAGLGLPLALRHLPRTPVIAVVGLAVFAFSAAQCVYVLAKITSAGTGADEGSIGVIGKEATVGSDWVDQRVPAGADVGLVPFLAGGYPEAIWWNVEFWNKTVTRAYASGKWGATHTPFPQDELGHARRTGELVTNDPPLASYFVMHREDLRFRPVGRVLAQTRELELVDLERPHTAGWASRGLGFQGVLWKGSATVRLYGGPGRGRVGRRVTFSVASSRELDPAVPRREQLRRRFELRGAGVRREGVLRPGEQRTEVLELCIPRGSATTIRLTGTAAGWHGREPGHPGLPIGVKVPAIEVVTAPGSCD